MDLKAHSLFVVIPAFRCKNKILSVIQKIPPFVTRVIIVDDACPDGTGKYVQEQNQDPRVEILFHTVNQGVGGAMVTGFRRAIELGAKIVIKIDGDDQMDPTLIPSFVAPIIKGRADHTKGNRFFYLDGLAQMPRVRLFGNAVLSFFNKLVSGYWNIMDPTNGYCATHTDVLKVIPLAKLSRRYFFESDLLFRLGTVRAVVQDIPMAAKYADEVSNLRVTHVLFSFPGKYLFRFIKRILYNYFLRDFTAGSLFLVSGAFLCCVGVIDAAYVWMSYYRASTNAPTGTIMIPVLLFLVGFQMLLFFLQQDVASVPMIPLHQGDDDE